MASYIFGGNTGETQESLKRKRAVAEAMLARATSGVPTDIGSGLTMIGAALGARIADWRADKAEKANSEWNADVVDRFTAGSVFPPAPSPVERVADVIAAKENPALANRGSTIDFANALAQPKLEPNEREGYAMNYLIGKGMAPHQAAGVVGNLLQESGLNTGARNPGDGSDGTDSIGIAQWNSGRARGLLNFAKQAGADAYSLDTQLDYVLHELGSNESAAGKALARARNAEEAAAAFIGFERPQGWSAGNPTGGHGWANRRGHAVRLSQGEWGAPAASRPVQVASLDPSAGVAEALAPQPERQAGLIVGTPTPATAPVPTPRPSASAPAPESDPDPWAGLRQPAPPGAGMAAPPATDPAAAIALPEFQAAQLSAGPSIQELMQAYGDPRIDDNTRSIIGQLVQRRQAEEQWVREQNSPANRIALEKAQLEVDALRNPGMDREVLPNGTVLGFDRRTGAGRVLWEGQTGWKTIEGNDGAIYTYPENDPRQMQVAVPAPSPKPIEVSPGATLVDPSTGKPMFTAPRAEPERPWWARPDGSVDPSQIANQEAGRTSVNVDTGGYKVPVGFMPADPANPESGVKPIPGGPAEQIPGELAARIGLADQFLTNVAPGVRERLADGQATGWWDRARAGNDQSSGQAAVYRDLELGTEALQRMMTGAGMPESEAANYARRFLPGYTDDASSAVAKLDQLTDALNGAREMAMRGRGGAPAGPATGTAVGEPNPARFGDAGIMPGAASPPAGKGDRLAVPGMAPQGAVDLLLKNPSLAPEFDRKYGQGSAARLLGAR